MLRLPRVPHFASKLTSSAQPRALSLNFRITGFGSTPSYMANSASTENKTDDIGGSSSDVSLYCSWFCPFAQRAWLALLLKDISFDYKEIDPYNKSKEWLAINPRGLVPAIAVKDVNGNAKVVYESNVILEYLDDAFSQSEGKSSFSLFPSGAYDKAMARIWIDHISKKIIRQFYQILQFKDQDKRNKAIAEYFEGVDGLVAAMDEEGPFFGGNAINAVDITYLPWAARMFLLQHYKNVNYKEWIGKSVADDNGKLLQRYEKWWQACSALKAFKATKADDEKMIGIYKRYADNTATSLVALAVNSGDPMP